MPSIQIDLSTERLDAFCKKWKVRELALFGSVLREDFRRDSDVDVLVTFHEDARWDLWQLIEAEQELAGIIGRKVDLVEKKNIVNPFRRHHILTHNHVICDAR